MTTAASPVHPAVAARPAEPALPVGFRLDTITSNLDLPTTFVFVPDGRIFIAEKSGRVKIWKDGQLYAQPLIDIHGEVNDFVDRGLLGMALSMRRRKTA